MVYECIGVTKNNFGYTVVEGQIKNIVVKVRGKRFMCLITVQQDATYSVYYISVGSSICFRC
jgi:hypothetical protein